MWTKTPEEIVDALILWQAEKPKVGLSGIKPNGHRDPIKSWASDKGAPTASEVQKLCIEAGWKRFCIWCPEGGKSRGTKVIFEFSIKDDAPDKPEPLSKDEGKAYADALRIQTGHNEKMADKMLDLMNQQGELLSKVVEAQDKTHNAETLRMKESHERRIEDLEKELEEANEFGDEYKLEITRVGRATAANMPAIMREVGGLIKAHADSIRAETEGDGGAARPRKDAGKTVDVTEEAEKVEREKSRGTRRGSKS